MAITSASMQAALGTDMGDPHVLRDFDSDGTSQYWYVEGRATARGRVRFCVTTASDNAATQAASVLAQLLA